VPDLRPVYDELCHRLSVHEDVFEVTHNLSDANTPASGRVDAPSPDTYLLLGAPSDRYPGGESFACVRLGKRYVSYYLMSVYRQPDTAVSEALTARRQGKSCFNFTRIDEELFDELDELTARGRDLYAAEGLLRR
jgi:hypothetical protein